MQPSAVLSGAVLSGAVLSGAVLSGAAPPSGGSPSRLAPHGLRVRLASATVLALVALGAPLPAVASCAGPHLDPQPRAVASGALLTVTGGGFADGCDDSGTVRSVPGCRDQQVRDSPARPAEGVLLVLLQGGRSWRLGTADAERDSTVRWEIRLPMDVAPGPAVLGASSAETPLVIG